ncbi:hypothetical protein ABFX02_05G014500 [Erythranthe guttata]
MGSSNNPFKEKPNSPLSKKLLSYLLYAFLPLILLHFYYKPFYFSLPFSYTINPNFIPPSSNSQEVLRKTIVPQAATCDYSNGEWVPHNQEPLYNGTTCDTIKQGQNCMVFGRPDKDYLHWKWNPKNCKLPRFNPRKFLDLLKNKHVAFVGDSLARNQLESLLCMVSVSSKPDLFYTGGDDNKFRKWHVSSHNITFSIYWSPFLVKGVEKTIGKDYNTLHLESVDERWAADLDHIDMLVLSIGHWYLHPAIYYYGSSIIGCHFCKNHTETGFYDVFGKALNTTFDSIIKRKGSNNSNNYGNGIRVFLTTFSPAHFEGEWDKLGACPKTRPFKQGERVLDGVEEELRRIGVAGVAEANRRCGNSENDLRFEALDVSKLAVLRPDGHPGPYMNPFPFANGVPERVQNDCVHWCLPGPIDTWNEILLDVIKRWNR